MIIKLFRHGFFLGLFLCGTLVSAPESNSRDAAATRIQRVARGASVRVRIRDFKNSLSGLDFDSRRLGINRFVVDKAREIVANFPEGANIVAGKLLSRFRSGLDDLDTSVLIADFLVKDLGREDFAAEVGRGLIRFLEDRYLEVPRLLSLIDKVVEFAPRLQEEVLSRVLDGQVLKGEASRAARLAVMVVNKYPTVADNVLGALLDRVELDRSISNCAQAFNAANLIFENVIKRDMAKDHYLKNFAIFVLTCHLGLRGGVDGKRDALRKNVLVGLKSYSFEQQSELTTLWLAKIANDVSWDSLEVARAILNIIRNEKSFILALNLAKESVVQGFLKQEDVFPLLLEKLQREGRFMVACDFAENLLKCEFGSPRLVLVIILEKFAGLEDFSGQIPLLFNRLLSIISLLPEESRRDYYILFVEKSINILRRPIISGYYAFLVARMVFKEMLLLPILDEQKRRIADALINVLNRPLGDDLRPAEHIGNGIIDLIRSEIGDEEADRAQVAYSSGSTIKMSPLEMLRAEWRAGYSFQDANGVEQKVQGRNNIELDEAEDRTSLWRYLEGFEPSKAPEKECAICYGDESDGIFLTTKCGHLFHKDCLKQAMQPISTEGGMTKGNQCPQCREVVAFSDLLSTQVGQSSAEEYDAEAEVRSQQRREAENQMRLNQEAGDAELARQLVNQVD